MVEPIRLMTETYTYADLLDWPEDARWELIDGVAYCMTLAPSRQHQEILGELYLQFGIFLRNAPCRVYLAPFDVRLPKPHENAMTASTVVQPDLAVICERAQLDQRGAVGGPTLVIEILSPYTAKKDRHLKRRVYEQAGVREYWIISPGEKTVEVYHLQGPEQYDAGTIYQYNDHVPVSVLPGLTIDLQQVFIEEGEDGPLLLRESAEM